MKKRAWVFGTRPAGAVDAPTGAVDDPVSHFRTALLTVAMTLAVVLCVVLLTYPRRTHVIKQDISPFGDVGLVPVRRVQIDRKGSISFDGARCADLSQFRDALDWQMQRDPTPEIWLEPDPELRYEQFLIVLATIKRARAGPAVIDYDPPSRPPLPRAQKDYCTPERVIRLPL